MAGKEVANSLVDSVWLRLTSRLAMIVTPVLFSAILYMGWQWLDNRFAEQKAALDAVTVRVTSVEAASLPTRVSILESTKQVRDKQIEDINSRIERNQDSVDAKLDKLVDGVNVISNQVAGLAATLKLKP